VKCSEFLRILKLDGWYIISQKGSHIKMQHPNKSGTIIFPNHGSAELGKGMEMKIKKDAQLK
jgi:predicted RNA binding protein YcfA (HicA-like mRNA interferase family)